MDTYIITAKTIEEAYALANRKYADATHDVSCEVVEMPKKGFLGIGAKDAKIKVTVTLAASADLGTVVADMRDMKKFTDRGEEPRKQNGDKKQGAAQGAGQGRPKPQNEGGSKQGQGGQRPADKKPAQPQGQKGQQKQQPKSAQPARPAQPTPQPEKKEKAETKPRSALHNGAKPNVRQQIKHTPGEEVTGASVTVGTPVGLTDFVSEKTDGFGSATRSGGSMSNDIKRKKPAKPMVSAEKADEKLRTSKYDMAESDDDYRSIESMIRDDEAQLEREAGAALGFTDSTPDESIPAAEPRKKEPVTQQEMDFALEFANTLLANMNLDARAVQCECPEGEDFEPDGDASVYPKIEIVGEDTGILIGHHGETLDAIQYLVNLSSLRRSKSKDGDYVKIVVDIENYREKREKTLKTLARRMAAKAVKYKRNVFLEPMNAYERRIIHSELQSYPDVSTHSVGTDRDRKIIITYEGADKQSDTGRARRRHGGQKQNRPAQPKSEGGSPVTEHSEHRRPKKIQKVPIEKLTDILDGDTTFLDGAKTEE